uniref:Uncharacterized protein n=1 Tax=Pseudomonas phage Touem01 TaxID=3138548 RepID=A0AAU6W1P4_9VIRU
MTIDRQEFKDLEGVVQATDRNVIRLQEQVSSMQRQIVELVSRAEFAPVKLIAYGLATAVGSSVIMAIIAKVIIK